MAVIYCGSEEKGVVIQSGMSHVLLPFTPYVPPMGQETKWVEVGILRAAKVEAGMSKCPPERKEALLLVEAYDPKKHDSRIRDYIEEMGVRAKDLDLAFAAHRDAAIAQASKDVPAKKDILQASIAELIEWLKRGEAIEQDADPKRFWGRRAELRERCFVLFGYKIDAPDKEAVPEANPIPRQAKDVGRD